MDRLDRILVAIGSVVLIFLGGLLLFSLLTQVDVYENSMQRVLKGEQFDYGALLTMSRALDFSIVKTSSLFLAFLLIFLGAIYILRTTTEVFKINVEGSHKIKGAFETSSPGLAMIFLGTILVAIVMFSKSYIEYTPAVQKQKTLTDIQKTNEQAIEFN